MDQSLTSPELEKKAREHCASRGLHPVYDSKYGPTMHGFIAGYKAKEAEGSSMILINGVPVPQNLMAHKTTLGLEALLGSLDGTETITFINCEASMEGMAQRMKELVERGCKIVGVNEVRSKKS